MESVKSIETNAKSKPLINVHSESKDTDTGSHSSIASTIQSIRDAHADDDNEVGFSDGYMKEGFNSISFKLSYIAIISYVLIGTLSYNFWMDGWTIIDAMYFTVVTFTTVGYGDLVPIGPAATAFTTIFVFIGVVLLGGVALSIIFGKFISMYEDISKEKRSQKARHYLNLFNGNICEDDDDFEKSLAAESYGILVNSVPLLIALAIPALVTGYLEGWSVFDSLYFGVITATTGETLCKLNELFRILFMSHILSYLQQWSFSIDSGLW